jgi:hypothetical protein
MCIIALKSAKLLDFLCAFLRGQAPRPVQLGLPIRISLVRM